MILQLESIMEIYTASKAVMISEEDFRAIEETLYLLSIPGMRESILKGRKESTDECSDQLTSF